MNHPFVNLPIYQEVLKLNLLIYEMELVSQSNAFNLLKSISDNLINDLLVNRYDNFVDFFKFSDNCKIPIYKYSNILISEISTSVYFTDALDAEITTEIIN